MLNFFVFTLLVASCSVASQQLHWSSDSRSLNGIAAPGDALYYLMADAGTSVAPTDVLRRTNRSLWKWLNPFGPSQCCTNNNNNVNNYTPQTTTVVPNGNNNCNQLQLQTWDPLKELKWLHKLPDLWGNSCSGNCGCSNGQPQPNNVYNYAAPTVPSYGGDGYNLMPPATPAAPATDYDAAPPNAVNDAPIAVYDGPGNGDAAYNTPPPSEGYEAPPAPTADDEAPLKPNSESYVVPSPVTDYEGPAAPGYGSTPTDSTPATDADYVSPTKAYGGAQLPQIVYQPIIYVSATVPPQEAAAYVAPPQEVAPPQQGPTYEAPPQKVPAYVAPPQETQSYIPPAQEAPAYAAIPQEVPAYVAPQQPTYAAPSPSAGYNAPACAGFLPLVGVPLYNYAAPPYSSCQAKSPLPMPAAPIYAVPPSPSPPPVPAVSSYVPPLAEPTYAVSPCRSPIRLSLIDQPYRVAPELFAEYNYRLTLAAQNRL